MKKTYKEIRKNKIIELYNNTNLNALEIAAAANCCKDTVLKVLKDNNIIYFRKNRKNNLSSEAKNKIVELYNNTNYNLSKIAIEVNCTEATVKRTLEANNIEYNSTNRRSLLKSNKREKEIVELYNTNRYTYKEVAKVTKTASFLVKQILKNNGYKVG